MAPSASQVHSALSHSDYSEEVRGKIGYLGAVKERHTVSAPKREQRRSTMKKGNRTVLWAIWDLLEAKNDVGAAWGCGVGVDNLVSPAGKTPHIQRGVIRYNTYQLVSCDPEHGKMQFFAHSGLR